MMNGSIFVRTSVCGIKCLHQSINLLVLQLSEAVGYVKEVSFAKLRHLGFSLADYVRETMSESGQSLFS